MLGVSVQLRGLWSRQVLLQLEWSCAGGSLMTPLFNCLLDKSCLLQITSFDMLQRLTCDVCKGRGLPKQGAKPCPNPKCTDPHNCMAGMGYRVMIVDGEQ